MNFGCFPAHRFPAQCLIAIFGMSLLSPIAFAAKPVAESAAVPAASLGAVPQIYTSDGADLAAFRQRVTAGDSAAVRLSKAVIADADKALASGPFSVVSNATIPPSGDKHDYMSLSPYWWPDPSKPDGKPYIRRDGEFNPERANYDLGSLEQLSEAVDDLSLAYYFSGDEKYAAHCAKLIRAWFIDPETRMNPNLKYAQSVPGYSEPRPSGIIEGGRFRKVIDAVGLIEGSASWSQGDTEAMKAWFSQMVEYVLTSEQGKTELLQPNNHATWATVQVATYALFTGQNDKAKEWLEKQFKRLLDSQVKPDGTQPEELARTLSFHYSRFNLLALVEVADLGKRVGLDLWNYKTEDGRCIRTALDYLVPYATKEKPWPHKTIAPIKHGDMVVILRRAANAYNEPKYEAAAELIRKEDKRAQVDMLFPSKLQ